VTIAAALFDLDGTLVDSLPDLTDAVNHMLSGFGCRHLEAVQVRQLVGKGARNLVQRALATESDEEISRGLEAFTAFNALHVADKSRLYPGARELLRQMASDGIRMAVISNKPEELSRLILRALEIDSFFHIIAGGDTFPEMKPSPLPLARVLDEFGCCAADAVMIGDSINDIQAGSRAGVMTVACSWGYGNIEELGGADYQAASLADIHGIIARTA